MSNKRPGWTNVRMPDWLLAGIKQLYTGKSKPVYWKIIARKFKSLKEPL